MVTEVTLCVLSDIRGMLKALQGDALKLHVRQDCAHPFIQISCKTKAGKLIVHTAFKGDYLDITGTPF